jgi:hypothetical protein
MEEKKVTMVSGRQFLFYLKDKKMFYKFTDDFGKTYSQEYEVQSCSIDHSISTIVPEGYILLRIKNKHRLGIPFHDGTILWHTLSEEERNILMKIIETPK